MESTINQGKSLTIAFTGDIAFTHYMAREENLLSNDIIKWLNESRFCICNIEGSLYHGEFLEEKKHLHASDPKYVEYLKKLNGNIWNLANNHMFDCGEEGLKSTCRIAKLNQIQCVGAGDNLEEASAPVILGDNLVGIISIGSNEICKRAKVNNAGCFLWDESVLIQRAILKIKKTCKWCAVIVHGGDEFCDIPFPDIRNRYHRYLKYGADIVIGHHPHVIQNYETVGNKIIFYSLGNFIFDTDYQRHQKHTDIGILLRIKFEENSFHWKSIAIKVSRKIDTPIYITDAPPIFRNLSDDQYKQLWPVAASSFVKKTEKRLQFMYSDRFQNRNQLWWAFHHMKRCKVREGRYSLGGTILSKFHSYEDFDETLLSYLKTV